MGISACEKQAAGDGTEPESKNVESANDEDESAESEVTQGETETVDGNGQYDQATVIDRDYPDVKVTFDGKPIEIRSAIAFNEEGSNTANTPEGAVRVHLFSLPTSCERAKKRFPLRKYKGEVVYLYQFQLGEATIGRTGGMPAEGLNTTGFGGEGWGKLDFLSIDTTPGEETTLEFEGEREPPPGMKDDAAGEVEVYGCGEQNW